MRWANLFGVPISTTLPPGFPQNTLPALHALTALSVIRPEEMELAFARLYHTSFVEGEEAHTAEAVLVQLKHEKLLGQESGEAEQVLQEVSPIFLFSCQRQNDLSCSMFSSWAVVLRIYA